ncbi:TKL protein kinase [Saprolegnia parasitica CBS 223.65]|uniref:TKL protein kinase n=1 Tax=Saprolegnia parasitica (strain CBS 223.65) TaxID=695850 RepID=A0A067CQ63_SAPPC|nr:TKL protein kinase [Saprolegnia parasitica CBS 223.65]KDO32829.1 TKL protein kinase [Saprolegnia parasitica CBS 223.65]|eukprot:XP_012196484.1 TKL protein kinase [Saprolegnia parasitica CBS 223.65]
MPAQSNETRSREAWLRERPLLKLPATAHTGSRAALKETSGSPHRIHRILEQDGVSQLIATWGKTTGYDCPYLPSPTKKGVPTSMTQARHLRNAPCHTLPSPHKPAWNASVYESKRAGNIGIILHNHKLAMTHSKERLPGHPKFLAQVVLPLTPELYGVDYDSDGASALDVNAHPQWRLRVHILHGANVVDPCRWRRPHVCSRLLRPYVQIVVPTAPVATTPTACNAPTTSPMWSMGWVDFRLLSNASFPSAFEVRVLNRCNGNELVVGEASIPIQRTRFCDFVQLRSRRGKPTGRIKLLYLLEGTVPPTPPPRNPLFPFADLATAKAALRKVDVRPPSVLAPSPTLRRPVSDVLALLETLRSRVPDERIEPEAISKANDAVIGEGISAAVYSLDDGKRVLKEFRYEEIGGAPPYPVVAAFGRELELWLSLRHANILELQYVRFSPRLGFVSAYMAGGSLYASRDRPTWALVTPVQKGYLALQVACALAYLHEERIVHRDLKLHNVLLVAPIEDSTSVPEAKLCDFGSAIRLGASKATDAMGTSGYTAPEVFSGDGYTYPSDIWSFGIFLWELFCPYPNPHSNPFAGVAPDDFIAKATHGLRPHLPSTLGGYGHVIEECWRLIPSERPAATSLIATLADLLPSSTSPSS